MPVNRNALIRYKTIDNCLRNRFRKWTLEDLIEACSEVLHDYEGIDKGVSRRTVQMDIQLMRSDKLGYHAPIVVIDRKYYEYEDPDYSITNVPLTEQDLNRLTEVVEILKQFKGFAHSRELGGMVQKLEDKVHVSRTHQRPIIELEKNEDLKGLEFLDPIYQAIAGKMCLEITYQSFRSRVANNFIFHPALLKEFRNRWFVLGKKKPTEPYLLLALDRIEELNSTQHPSSEFADTEITHYFENVVGVTVSTGDEPQEIRLLVDHKTAPYVLTKPIHHSQRVEDKSDQGVTISLFVQLNFELEREILGFGDSVKVLSPLRLRSRIKERLNHAIDLYQTELNESMMQNLSGLIDTKGYAISNYVYTRKEIALMGSLLHSYKSENELIPNKEVYAIRDLLNEVPELTTVIFNHNLKSILKNLDPGLFMTKAIFFDKPSKSNWYVTWHQDTTINVKEKLVIEGYKGWTKKGSSFGVCPPENILFDSFTIRIHLDDTTEENGALYVLPGSHKKKLSDDEVHLITNNSIPKVCEVNAGGVHLMKPLLLHSSSKTTNNKNRRVIHLEFNSVELPEGMEWAERVG